MDHESKQNIEFNFMFGFFYINFDLFDFKTIPNSKLEWNKPKCPVHVP